MKSPEGNSETTGSRRSLHFFDGKALSAAASTSIVVTTSAAAEAGKQKNPDNPTAIVVSVTA